MSRSIKERCADFEPLYAATLPPWEPPRLIRQNATCPVVTPVKGADHLAPFAPYKIRKPTVSFNGHGTVLKY
jgi:hypothetical protein